MRILKIIFVIFAIYFIRRFIQMYRVMKQIQEQQENNLHRSSKTEAPGKTKDSNVIDADFKVMD